VSPEPIEVAVGGDGPTLTLDGADLVLVGYSGRDTDAVRAHVAELAAHGVPAPAEVPSVWRVPSTLLTQSSAVVAEAGTTSGEVEPVLLLIGGEAYLTVGSDHTDRVLERTSMDGAKAACPKVLARACWPVAGVRAGWDAIALRSEIEVDGAWRPYQHGVLGALLPPEWYVERFAGARPAVVFCGTVPAPGGLVTDATRFRAVLEGGPAGRIECEYAIGAASDGRI